MNPSFGSRNDNDDSPGYGGRDTRDTCDDHLDNEDRDGSARPGPQENRYAANTQYALDPGVLSVVEDLDPDVSGTPASWRNRELVLGLVVLLCVLGWVGGSWLHDESNRSHYEQAQQAAADRRWDDALANYSAAAGYKDADALASDAARQIEERDRQYEVATAHRSSGPAALALQAARAVETIEPGYKDVDALAAQAEAQAYTDALSGTVVMRTQATPAGLYYMGPSGWLYLRGSDQWSSVLSTALDEANGRYVVYDVAGPGWTPPTATATPTGTATPAPSYYGIPQGSPDKAGRALVIATLLGGSGDPTYSTLHLNPADYNYYICNRQGVWGLRYLPSNTNPIVPSSAFGSASMVYEPISALGTAPKGPITATVVMPGTGGMVVDFGRDTGLLLLAARGASIDGKSATNLYVTAGDGGNARLVFSTTGALLSAKISPDEHHALVVTAQAPASSAAPGAQAIDDKMVVSAALVSLDRSGQDAPPTTLLTVSMNALMDAGGMPYLVGGGLTMNGVFLEQGAFKDTLLLAWRDPTAPTQARLRLVDVSHSWKTLYDGAIDYSNFGYVPQLAVEDGQAIFIYSLGVVPTVETGKQPTAGVTMLSAQTRKEADGTTPSTTVTAANLALPLPQEGIGGTGTGTSDSEFISNPALVGSNLIYDTSAYTADQFVDNVYSIPISQAQQHGGVTAQPLLVHTSSFPLADQTLADEAQRGTAGPGAYAYVDAQHTLHAHLYDADVEVVLESGIEAIFPLTPPGYENVLF